MQNLISRYRAMIACCVGLLLLAVSSTAFAAAGVKDNGHFFKSETVEKVDTELQQAQKDFGKELVVETYATVPDAMKSEFDTVKDDKDKRAEFFAKWLGERAHELQVNGVYVLICKDPGHVEVKAGAKTREKGEFTQVNQNKMRDLLVTAFKDKNYDDGLQKAADYFRQSLKENLGGVRHTGASVSADEQFHRPGGYSTGSPYPTQGSNPPVTTGKPAGSKLVWIVLVVIGAFIIIRILSNLGGGSRNYGGGGTGYGPGPGANYSGGGPGYGGGGGGGGGFLRNMFGGMVGGAAGGYLYDRFRDRNQGSGTTSQGGNPGTSGGDFGGSASDDNDRGQGFGGGGSSGDLGSSDSGSSFGSSDSGSSGGDFGGSSDSGSSGGDSGGGGGSGGDF